MLSLNSLNGLLFYRSSFHNDNRALASLNGNSSEEWKANDVEHLIFFISFISRKRNDYVDSTKLCVNISRGNFLNIFLLERVEQRPMRTRSEKCVGGVNGTWKKGTLRDVIGRRVVVYEEGLITKWKLKIKTLACLRSAKRYFLQCAVKVVQRNLFRFQLTELCA